MMLRRHRSARVFGARSAATLARMQDRIGMNAGRWERSHRAGDGCDFVVLAHHGDRPLLFFPISFTR